MNKKIAIFSIAATLLLGNCAEGMEKKESELPIVICFYKTWPETISDYLVGRKPSRCGFGLVEGTTTEELEGLIKEIYEYDHKLIYLSVIECPLINLNKFDSQDFPSLEKLEMFYTDNKQHFLNNIIANTKLTYLHLDRHWKTDLKKINWEKAKHLQTLVLKKTNISLDVIREIIRKTPNLKYFHLYEDRSRRRRPSNTTPLNLEAKQCKIKFNSYVGPFVEERESTRGKTK